MIILAILIDALPNSIDTVRFQRESATEVKHMSKWIKDHNLASGVRRIMVEWLATIMRMLVWASGLDKKVVGLTYKDPRCLQ